MEFTQIDCEMSFVEQEDIISTFEGMAKHLFKVTQVVAQAAGMDYEDFVKKNQFERLGLRHTAFTGDLGGYHKEDLSLTGNIHQLFKTDGRYIDPVETASSYREDGSPYG